MATTVTHKVPGLTRAQSQSRLSVQSVAPSCQHHGRATREPESVGALASPRPGMPGEPKVVLGCVWEKTHADITGALVTMVTGSTVDMGERLEQPSTVHGF